jgi:transposase InsO family protein
MDLKNTFSSLDFQGRFSGETNGKLERFYGVYDQKRHQFKSIDEYVHWHNEIKPHMSLNWETLETPIQAFQRKQRPKQEKTETAEPLVK